MSFDGDRIDGHDPSWIARALPFCELLNRHWLRLVVEGEEHLPAGPALYVGNHNGGVFGPDLPCTLATLWRHLAGQSRRLTMMTHDLAMRTITPLGRLVQRLGAVRASPENALRALAAGNAVLVYPGGEHDAYRPFRDRNRIVFGGRTGFVRLAQRARVPIVPIVAYGAHRSAVFLDDGRWLAMQLQFRAWTRMERVPIAIALPWLLAVGPLPYLPLPLPITLRILPPFECPPDADPEELRDEVVWRMQAALDDLAA